VWTWGSNSHGQLGLGTVGESEAVPRRIDFQWDGTPFQIAVGWSHTAVVTGAGRLYTFGSSKSGALGHGGTETRAVPTVVKSLMDKNVCQARVLACRMRRRRRRLMGGGRWRAAAR
jgi:alpha-tubulin suppressor-like RCC1 family protein